MLDVGGLNTAQRQIFETALVHDYTRYIRVSLMDISGGHITDISNRILTGQVTVDGGAQVVQRVLQATFEDRSANLGFDTGNPGDGVMTSDRMLRIYWEVYVVGLLDWVSCPIFTGPITQFQRDGGVITLEAHSKEERMGTTIWTTFTVKKGSLKTEAIRTILKKGGESQMDLEDSPGKTLKSDILTVQGQDTYWAKAKSVADGLSKELFYDAYGRARLRTPTTAPVFTFRDGDWGSIISEPKTSYSEDDMRNIIMAVGKTPTSGKAPTYTAYLPVDHPLSRESLARIVDGVPVLYEKGDIIQNEEYEDVADCTAAAKKSLTERTDGTVGVAFDSFVIPHLEPGDPVAAVTSRINVVFTLKTFTIPLALEDNSVMNVGYASNQVANVGLIRNRVAA